MQYVDEIDIKMSHRDIFEITAEDYPMTLKVPVHRETLEAALTDSVENGDLSDWMIDLVQEMLKNRYKLGDLPITAAEFEKTNAILEELRI